MAHLEVKTENMDPLFMDSMQPVFTNWPQQSFDNQHVTMPSSYVSLVPSNLARPPVQWSAQEVKAWLEFCAEEFSLSPVGVDKFDMNGKALLLLTKQDFLERAPHAGDVLYNAFQYLRQSDGPVYPCQLPASRPAVFVPSPTQAMPPSDALHGLPHPQNCHGHSTYIPILPQPPHTTTITTTTTATINNYNNNNNNIGSNNCGNNIGLKEPSSEGAVVPTSMLSPAPSEKSPSDSDSCHAEAGGSPNINGHDIDCEENLPHDHTRDITQGPSDDGVSRLLWEFIYQLLQDNRYTELVCWESVGELTFRINNPTNLAEMWGLQKNRTNMTYEKLSRALRYYYKMHIIKKVPGKRLTYQFLQHPTHIRKGQRGARPHASRNMNTEATDEVTSAHNGPGLCPKRTSSMSSSSSTTTVLSNDYMHDMPSPKQLKLTDSPCSLEEASTCRENEIGSLNHQESMHQHCPNPGHPATSITERGKEPPAMSQKLPQGPQCHMTEAARPETNLDYAYPTKMDNPSTTSKISSERYPSGNSGSLTHMEAVSTVASQQHTYHQIPLNLPSYPCHDRNCDGRQQGPISYIQSFPGHRMSHDHAQGLDNSMRRPSSVSPSSTTLFPSPSPCTSRSLTPSYSPTQKKPGHCRSPRPNPAHSPRQYDPIYITQNSFRQDLSSYPPRHFMSTNSSHYGNQISEPPFVSGLYQKEALPENGDSVHRAPQLMKREEQEEPEDLSMKSCLRRATGSAEENIKSEICQGRDFGVQDPARDSTSVSRPCTTTYENDKMDVMGDTNRSAQR